MCLHLHVIGQQVATNSKMARGIPSCTTLFLIVVSQIHLVKTKIISGEIKSREDWAFMTRFCFKDSYGQMQYRFEYPQEYQVQNILLYFDTQWPKVYPKPDMDCAAKEDKLYKGNNQVINLTLSYIWSGCNLETINKVKTLVCKGDRKFLSIRARWWYIALSNCQSKDGLNVKYFLNLTNGDTFWTMHFSADEREIIKTDIFFLILFVILVIISVNTSYGLVTRRLFHYTFKLFLWSLVLELISLMIYIAYYVDYGKTGKSKYSVQVAARVVHYIAHIIFLILLILLAKGWTVTRGRISSFGQVKLSAFCTLYAVCFAVLFIFESAVFDPGRVLYIYESPAGIGICVLRVIAWLWFCYGTFFTLKHYPSKSAFYYPFWFFYTGW
ncbi:hypothetical protein QZH41_013012 [Actinostola sp. cb2023]|nr:hypothetical protein QZH41_013012 [Actinostola sp. cb2023]